jgi:hypothetical protein
MITTSDIAQIPRTNNYTYGGILTTPNNAELDGRMSAAIYFAIMDPTVDKYKINLSAQCRSGNCTFPNDNGATFVSLGMCHSCQDISERILRNTTHDGYYLESWDGRSMARVGLTPNPFDPNDPMNMRMFDSKTTQASNQTMNELLRSEFIGLQVSPDCDLTSSISSSISCPKKPWAYSCSLYPCLKTYNSSISAGYLNETILSTVPLMKTDPAGIAVVVSPNLTFSTVTDQTLRDGHYHACDVSDQPSPSTPVAINPINNTLYLPGSSVQPRYTNPDCVWMMAYTPALALTRFVATLFDKSLIAAGSNTVATQGPIWLKNLYRNGTATESSVNDFMTLLTTAMTATIRGSTAQSAKGSVLTAETCVAVRWAWLGLPASLVGMTMLFLGVTVARCAKEEMYIGAWRSSSLSGVFYGLDPGVRERVGMVGLVGQREMIGCAERIEVQMASDGEGVGLRVISIGRDLGSKGDA